MNSQFEIHTNFYFALILDILLAPPLHHHPHSIEYIRHTANASSDVRIDFRVCQSDRLTVRIRVRNFMGGIGLFKDVEAVVKSNYSHELFLC